MRLLLLFLFCLLSCVVSVAEEPPRPNVIIIFTDDQGYGDLGCFGSETIRTPHIDTLGRDGRKMTNFLVASPVCSPSRAALLTGCYPRRVGMHQHVIFPADQRGLHPDEHTIADHLKALGYATGCFGKWHLGHRKPVLPTANGFDTYFGIPYSNDMNHPDNKGKPKGGHAGMDILWNDPESTLTKWKTPLMQDEEILEVPVDQRLITRRCTDRAIAFITEHKDGPFFVYVPHSMPHIPLYVPDDVRDPDPKNAYINTIEHIDTETGRLLAAVDDLGLRDSTYVIYTTDNGPWLSFKHHGGSAGPLRDGKGTTFEGGQRVPCLVRGPGIPAGTECGELAASIDLLPTIATLTDSVDGLSSNRIDGLDISGLLTGEVASSPRSEFLYYTSRGDIEGIRQGIYKLLVKYPRRRRGAPLAAVAPVILLFDLEADIAEANDLSRVKPELVAKLKARMNELAEEIEVNARPQWRRG